jgi:hypothetical protein
LFALDDKKASFVNVTSKAYRGLTFQKPGAYVATLNYNDGSKTTARWTVRDIKNKRRAKNVIFFIGESLPYFKHSGLSLPA